MLKCFFHGARSSRCSDSSHTSTAISLSHDTTVSLASRSRLISLCAFFFYLSTLSLLLFLTTYASTLPATLILQSCHPCVSYISVISFAIIMSVLYRFYCLFPFLLHSNCQGLSFKNFFSHLPFGFHIDSFSFFFTAYSSFIHSHSRLLHFSDYLGFSFVSPAAGSRDSVLDGKKKEDEG